MPGGVHARVECATNKYNRLRKSLTISPPQIVQESFRGRASTICCLGGERTMNWSEADHFIVPARKPKFSHF